MEGACWLLEPEVCRGRLDLALEPERFDESELLEDDLEPESDRSEV